MFQQALANNQVLSKVDSNLKAIRTAGGNKVQIHGVYIIRFYFDKREYVGPFTVVENLSSDIIVGIVGARDMRLDYSVTDNKFTFRNNQVKHSPYQIQVAKRKEITSRAGGSLRCVATIDGRPVANKQIIANVLDTEIITNTDSSGQFSVQVSNPSLDTLTYQRSQLLGEAEEAEALDMEMPVQDDTVATVTSLLTSLPISKVQEACVEAIKTEHKGKVHIPLRAQKDLEPQFMEATKHLDKATRDLVLTVLWKNWQASSANKFDLGLSRVWQHQITLADKTPAFRKQFPIPMQHVPVIREHVDRWLQLGIVEPARSPYNSPIFCVKKKGGGFRLCLDYRALNAKSLPENYTIRTPEDCMAEIGQNGGKFFIALDLTSGFYQMNLHPNSRHYTAFTVPPYGQLQWTRGAMGLKGCPGSFARLMDITLKGIPHVLIYIDDVLIYGKTKLEAIQTLNAVLKRLSEHNLKVNIGKSAFFAPKTEYLGHTLSTEGISPGKHKTSAILEAKPPTTVKGIKSFLGMINYFRSYIKHFAQRAGVLYNLIKANSTWKEGPLPPTALKCFNDLKGAIANVVPRAFPFPNGKYYLYTDGSLGDDKLEGGLGGHLMQEGPDGTKHTIAFASRALRAHEKNYSAFLLELQAAVVMIEHFDHYLKGRSFVLLTDHAPMTSLSKVHTKTLHRLHTLLNDYSFEIQHIPGRMNPVADFLSRSNGAKQVDTIAAISNDVCLRQAQEEDALLGPVVRALQAGQTPAWPAQLVKWAKYIKLHFNYLCIELPFKLRATDRTKLRAIAPQALQQALLQEAHDSALGGHQGIFRTAERIKDAFWWPSMDADVTSHVNRCHICQATTNKQSPYVPEHHELPQCTRPNERVHMDLFGPIEGADGKEKYILSMTDAFTKVVRLVVIPNKEATTVAWAIWKDWCTIYGIPMNVFTDNGREFLNQLQKAIFDVLRVKHGTTTPYWPKCNLMAERQNKELAKYLRAVLLAAEKSTVQWEAYIPALTLSLNTAINRATKQAPFYTMFGYDARLPLWEAKDILNQKQFQLPPNQADNFYQWQDARKAAQQIAFSNEQHFRSQYPSQDRPQAAPQAYAQHQPVFVRVQHVTTKNRKFAPKYEPAVIMQRLSATTYKVKRLEAKTKKIITTNAFHLKPREAGSMPEIWKAQSQPQEMQTTEDDEHENDPLDSQSDEPPFHGWEEPPVQVPAEEASEPLLSPTGAAIAAVTFTKKQKRYNLQQWLERPDISEAELMQAVRAVLQDKTDQDFTLVEEYRTWEAEPRQPPPPRQPRPPPMPPGGMGQAPPPAPPMPVPPSPMDWQRRSSSSSSSSASMESPAPRSPPASPPGPPTPMTPPRLQLFRPAILPAPIPREEQSHQQPQQQQQQQRRLQPSPMDIQLSQPQEPEAAPLPPLPPPPPPRTEDEYMSPPATKRATSASPEGSPAKITATAPPPRPRKPPPPQQPRERAPPPGPTAPPTPRPAPVQTPAPARQESPPQAPRRPTTPPAAPTKTPQKRAHQQTMRESPPETPPQRPRLQPQEQPQQQQQHQQVEQEAPQQVNLQEQLHPKARHTTPKAQRSMPRRRSPQGPEKTQKPTTPAKRPEARSARRQILPQDSGEETEAPPSLPPRGQQQQQQVRSERRPVSALPEGTKIQSPPFIARKIYAKPPSSDMEYDTQREAARRYSEAREVARDYYLQYANKSCPENCDQTTWRAHHQGIFDAMNPHPSGLFPHAISPQRREYPATPEEMHYLRTIEQYKLSARPSKVKTVKEVHKDAQKRYK